MMKRRGLCTTRTIVGALVLTMGAITTSTIAQEIGPAVGSKNSLKINQGPINTDHNCPVTFVDADGGVHMTQNDNIFVDDETTVACGIAGVGTTPNGWARCFDLVAEGINGDLQIDVVYFGIQQATINNIVVDVNLYIVESCDFDPGADPGEPDYTSSRLVGPGDELGSLKPVYFDGVVIPAGSILVIEIAVQADGTEEPLFQFRPRSNAQGECAPSYLRAAACGIPGWIGTGAIGFPDSQVVIKCLGQEIDIAVPEGDTCDDCIPVGEGVFEGTTSDNSEEPDITSCTFSDTVTEWYCYTASCTGTATVSTCGSSYDTALSAWDACPEDGGNQIACNDDACGLQSTITFPVVAGGTYYVRVSGFNNSSGNYILEITCQEPQPTGCDNCTELFDGITFGSTIGAPSEDDIQTCTFGGPSATETVWYCYTASCDGIVTMDTCGPGTDYDTVLGAWSACPEDGGVQLACNDDDCPGFKSIISWEATQGVTYFIRVSGFANTEGNFELNVVCGDGPPPNAACTPDAGDCCSPNGTPGCNGEVCCNIICNADPFCCDVEWDGICAAAAEGSCGKLCGGPPPGGDPCDCPDGALEEGEPCGDDTNGGCNSSPIVFTEASCGDTFCGNAWAAGGTRDTDWYIIDVADPDGDGFATITGTLYSEFDGVVFIVGGIANCAPVVLGDTGASSGCKSNGAASAVVDAPGTYVVFVANAGFAGNPCGSGNTYTLEITCEDGGDPPPGPCNPDAGDCCSANGTPGCNDEACCELICGQDPFCCESSWDGICAAAAAELCGICDASPPCPWDLDGDGNVGTSDLLILFSQWGLDDTADFDRSGAVGTSDLLILFANWGPCP